MLIRKLFMKEFLEDRIKYYEKQIPQYMNNLINYYKDENKELNLNDYRDILSNLSMIDWYVNQIVSIKSLINVYENK